MLILSRKEVEELLDPRDIVPALQEGFKALSAGQLDVPPRNQVGAPKGVLLGMYAFMPGKPFSVKLVSIFHESTPSHQAIITLFNSETGAAIALMDGEYITAMRTAAASLLSIQHLAHKDSKTVAIIGTGVQAESHLKMIGTLVGIEKIWIASRNRSAASALASHASNAHAAESIHEAVSNADIVCLCTSSPEPVIKKEWLKEGVHITSVGYRPPGGELPRNVIEASNLFVESKRAFEPPPSGSAELQGLPADFGTELGELLLKQKPGRRSETEWTVYKSMGHAMEDLVAASLVYEKAIERGMGMKVEL